MREIAVGSRQAGSGSGGMVKYYRLLSLVMEILNSLYFEDTI